MMKNIFVAVSLWVLVSACCSLVAMDSIALQARRLADHGRQVAGDAVHAIGAAVEGAALSQREMALYNDEVLPLLSAHLIMATATDSTHKATCKEMRRRPGLVALIPAGIITAGFVHALVSCRPLPKGALLISLAGPLLSWLGFRELFLRNSCYAAYANPVTLASRTGTWVFEKIAALQIAHKQVPDNVLRFASHMASSKTAREFVAVDFDYVPQSTQSFARRLAAHQV